MQSDLRPSEFETLRQWASDCRDPDDPSLLRNGAALFIALAERSGVEGISWAAREHKMRTSFEPIGLEIRRVLGYRRADGTRAVQFVETPCLFRRPEKSRRRAAVTASVRINQTERRGSVKTAAMCLVEVRPFWPGVAPCTPEYTPRYCVIRPDGRLEVWWWGYPKESTIEDAESPQGKLALRLKKRKNAPTRDEHNGTPAPKRLRE